MVNQQEALNILNKEKDYEDKLASNLNNYFILNLDYIKNLSKESKEKIKEVLSQIAFESERHSYKFQMLIQGVLENKKDNY